MNESNAAATEAQLSTIRARAVNDEARAMMAGGVTLTHEQADDLGQEALAWVGGRLGLNVRETDGGVECSPPKHYAGEEARRAGVEVQDDENEPAVITDDQIKALRNEAGEAGDIVQVVMCDRALGEVLDWEDYAGGGHSASEMDGIRAVCRGSVEDARTGCREALA